MAPFTIRTSVALAGLSLVLSGCTAEPPADAPEPTPPEALVQDADFQRIRQVLDEEGWLEEPDFDWTSAELLDTDVPEARAALSMALRWLRYTVFSEEAHGATSSLGLLEAVEPLADSPQFSRYLEEFREDPKEGLDDAALYGLVFTSDVSLVAPPRVAVSTLVDDGTEDSAAEIEVTVRAVLPVTDGELHRWGVYSSMLTFDVPHGYDGTDATARNTAQRTTMRGLSTCDFSTHYSAEVVPDRFYLPERILRSIEYAAPDADFTYEDFATSDDDADDDSPGIFAECEDSA